jgi:excinuclease ABC subunit C
MKGNIKHKLTQLPKQPGVYFFKNARGKIIYVGKAAVLKNRVSSYFLKSTKHGSKNQVMMGEIADVDWVEVNSEIDALFLESELIKRYKPKFNIELRDDKHYLYVKITTKAKYPTLTFVRRPLDDGASYFGPYIEGFALRKALRYLRRIFPYNTHETMPKRVCLQYHLGLCPGLEEAKMPIEEYRASLRKLMMFLKGERSLLIKQLEKEMKQAAKAHDFERAAGLRNQAHNLRALSKQIVFSDEERFDVTRDQALNGLAKLLDLKGEPRRIEAYDISHISGTDNVASMIVFLDGVAAKREYRKFKMRLAGNDDFAHMREVITRRFGAQNLGKWGKPDLLVIDGGKGQLAAALEAMETVGVNFPAIGLAKREETIIQRTLDPLLKAHKFSETRLERDSETLKLLQRIRDESHRFAVAYHSLLRSQRHTSSMLEDIPGLGPATRKKLIKHFGSLAGVKRATQAEISQVVGPKMAARLEAHLGS